MGMEVKSNLLIRALAANSAFSALTGAVLIAASVPLSDWLGVPTWLTALIGAGLLPFAFVVGRTARDPEPSRVIQVIIADVSWVIGAAVILFGFPSWMSGQGLWALAIVTGGVALFAVLQTVGLRRQRA